MRIVGAYSAVLRDSRLAAPLFAIGVSLGGNALLKWLGEQRDAAPAATIGVGGGLFVGASLLAIIGGKPPPTSSLPQG